MLALLDFYIYIFNMLAFMAQLFDTLKSIDIVGFYGSTFYSIYCIKS